MVECECIYITSLSPYWSSFNRYMVECEFDVDPTAVTYSDGF